METKVRGTDVNLKLFDKQNVDKINWNAYVLIYVIGCTQYIST